MKPAASLERTHLRRIRICANIEEIRVKNDLRVDLRALDCLRNDFRPLSLDDHILCIRRSEMVCQLAGPVRSVGASPRATRCQDCIVDERVGDLEGQGKSVSTYGVTDLPCTYIVLQMHTDNAVGHKCSNKASDDLKCFPLGDITVERGIGRIQQDLRSIAG